MNNTTILIYPHMSLEDETGKGKINFKKLINRMPPLGLMYIASSLESKGHRVRIIDGQLDITNDQIVKIIEKENPKYIGLSFTSNTYYSAISLAKQIKKINPSIIIIAGGPHVSSLPEEVISKEYFDIVSVGEGEISFPKLISELNKDKPNLETVKGIYFKKNNKIIKTEKSDIIHNLDLLPFPSYHLIRPLKKYNPTPISYKSFPQATMITSRGCPGKCHFCDKSIFGYSYRERSAKNVVDEIEMLIKKNGIKDIKFFDDTFAANKKRLYEILKLIKIRKLKFTWSCHLRVDQVDFEMLKKMKDAGCWQVLFGIESLDQIKLDQINKETTVKQNETAIKLADKAGISVRCELICGTPGDTIESMEKTLTRIKKLNPDFVFFNKYTPYPGSMFYRLIKHQGKHINFEQKLPHLDNETFLYIPDTINENDFKKFLNKSYRGYYLRPKYIIKMILKIRNLKDIKMYINGFLSFFN